MMYALDEQYYPLPRLTMLYEANMSNPNDRSDVCVESNGVLLSNRHCLKLKGRGLHVNWCHGKGAGVGKSNNCVGVPTTFGRHCRSPRILKGLILLRTKFLRNFNFQKMVFFFIALICSLI